MDKVLYVVETHDDIFLGIVEFKEGALVVKNGFVGRPVTIPVEDLVSMKLADEHPDVEQDALPEFGNSDYYLVG